ncbi:hypothetical protein [Actinomadura napierensis]|uniref:Uncharacterized protein n=1 Tax=Actinomadura napierensis TaxID=267854 RepID=A0ABN3AIV4_9ACTN
MTETVPTDDPTGATPEVGADVAAMLARCGLPAGPYELAYLTAEYPYLKAGIDMLYAVTEARDADPVLHFRAGVPDAR